jgi:hypothetical protein
MTYGKLLLAILDMTPEQRKQNVKLFISPPAGLGRFGNVSILDDGTLCSDYEIGPDE